MSKKKYYLAYGSNLNKEQMYWRCPEARALGKAVIPDYRLVFRGSKTGSYLTIEPAPGSSVPVGVWEVSDWDEMRLDMYEGYPDFYYKKDMLVNYTGLKTGKSRTRNAFAYIMHEDRPFGLPTNRYVENCMEGYRDFGFDPEILKRAIRDTEKEIYHERG